MSGIFVSQPDEEYEVDLVDPDQMHTGSGFCWDMSCPCHEDGECIHSYKTAQKQRSPGLKKRRSRHKLNSQAQRSRWSMAKVKLSSFDPTTHVLIVRNADGKHINGTGSRGDLSYAEGLARSFLRIDRTGVAALIEIFRYDRTISWRELQPLAVVILDDEEQEEL